MLFTSSTVRPVMLELRLSTRLMKRTNYGFSFSFEELYRCARKNMGTLMFRMDASPKHYQNP